MNNKLIIGIVIVIAILILVLVVSGRSGNDMASPSPEPSGSPSPSTSASSTPRATGGVPQSILSYQDALKKYAGTRFQLDARCQATPSQITIKKGAAIMLDNRSGDARTVSVGSVKYSLAGYGFRIVTPTASVLPATLLIDCGSAQNVGKVIIQK